MADRIHYELFTSNMGKSQEITEKLHSKANGLIGLLRLYDDESKGCKVSYPSCIRPNIISGKTPIGSIRTNITVSGNYQSLISDIQNLGFDAKPKVK